jgi:hypothetical protein
LEEVGRHLQTFRKRRQAQLECNNGIKNQDLKVRLHLGSKGNVNEIFWETLGLEITKKIFHQDSKNEHQDIMEGLAPSETKEEIAYRVGAGDVGSLATLRTFGRTNQRKMMVINLDHSVGKKSP